MPLRARVCLLILSMLFIGIPLPSLLAETVEPAPAPVSVPATDSTVTIIKDLPYRSGADLDENARTHCVLDLYLPREAPAGGALLPVMVWFHGGGLEGGDKLDKLTRALAVRYAAGGIAMAVANYRLSPTVRAPIYIDDAAASVAWVVAHIAEYGGDPHALFIAGHSAGGYLAAMLAADPSYLTTAGVPPGTVAGVIPVSGQVFTHFTIRKERGVTDPQKTPIIDELAPCYHAAKAKTMPPMLLICGDRDWVARAEENRYFLAALKDGGATDVSYLEVPERNHGSIIGRMIDSADPAAIAIIAFVTAHSRASQSGK